jgi:AraC family transcriptional regulator
MTLISTPLKIKNMSEQLRRVELNFDNAIIHSKLYKFEKKVYDSGLSIKLGHRGEEHYFIDNKKYAITRGEYLLVNRHRAFDCHLDSSELIEGFCLYLSQPIILETIHTLESKNEKLLDSISYNERREPQFLEKVYSTSGDVLGQFLEGIRPMLERNQLLDLDSFFYTLAEKLLISQASINKQIDSISAARRSTREELYRRLSIARQYIQDNFQKDIQLEELSREAMLSKFHLLRSYREAFGTTPYRQVLNLRLKHSVKLLQEGQTLESIALSLGFSDRRSFTKAFKKVFGCAPSHYRATLYAKPVNFGSLQKLAV